jgi:succinoglycan biosynthesis protein ExoU
MNTVPALAPVCIIIAAYNAAATIRRAIVSALAQNAAGEVIVVDDASTDNTAAVAECANDATGRLRIIRLDRNEGPAAARNHALDRTALPFVSMLDADDYMLPNRLERLVREAEAGYDLVADDIVLLNDGSDEVVGSLFDIAPRVPGEVGFAAFVIGNLSDPGAPRRELGYLKPLIRRDFLERHRLRYDPTLRLGEDFMLYATALASGARFRLVIAGGYVAVARPDSLSHRHRTEDLRALLMADEKLSRRPGLSRNDRRALRRHRRDTRSKYRQRQLLDIKNRYKLLRYLARRLRGFMERVSIGVLAHGVVLAGFGYLGRLI